MEALFHHFFNIDALWLARLVLFEGILGTLKLGAAALALAPSIGVLIFLVQISPWPAVQRFAEWYIDLLRAFPLLVFLVITYYLLLPMFGVRIDPFVAAVWAFGLKHSVYFAEIYRGGWLAIDRGQFHAAYALGLRPLRVARSVIIPQMSLVILPSLTNQATLVLRDLPLAFMIGYFELLTSARAAQVFARNSTPIVCAIVLYSVTLLILQWFTGRIEEYSRRRMEA